MPNKRPSRVRKTGDVDARVARSTRALAAALVELLEHRDFDSITVQAILDRARVGRATFYAHFRNKEDVLHSSYEGALAWFEERLLARRGDRRLFPVAEFVEHAQEMTDTLAGLRRSGQLTAMRGLFVSQAAHIIARRLTGIPDESHRRLTARMLAGALAEAVEWHDVHRDRTTPRQVDDAFHALARSVLYRWA